MPRYHLPLVGITLTLSRLTGGSPVAALAGSHLLKTLLRQRYMTEDKQNTPFSPDDRRTEYVGAKVTPEQKRHIRRLAEACGMTVSSYILARASGYRPKARLTARQETVMETLIAVSYTHLDVYKRQVHEDCSPSSARASPVPPSPIHASEYCSFALSFAYRSR